MNETKRQSPLSLGMSPYERKRDKEHDRVYVLDTVRVILLVLLQLLEPALVRTNDKLLEEKPRLHLLLVHTKSASNGCKRTLWKKKIEYLFAEKKSYKYAHISCIAISWQSNLPYSTVITCNMQIIIVLVRGDHCVGDWSNFPYNTVITCNMQIIIVLVRGDHCVGDCK